MWLLFVFVYCVPLIILSSTNAMTLIGLKRMHEKVQNGIQTGLSARRIEMERRIVKSKYFLSILTLTPKSRYSKQEFELFQNLLKK